MTFDLFSWGFPASSGTFPGGRAPKLYIKLYIKMWKTWETWYIWKGYWETRNFLKSHYFPIFINLAKRAKLVSHPGNAHIIRTIKSILGSLVVRWWIWILFRRALLGVLLKPYLNPLHLYLKRESEFIFPGDTDDFVHSGDSVDSFLDAVRRAWPSLLATTPCPEEWASSNR